MVFGVIAVVEKEPVINFSIAADAPRNRFIGIGTVMPVVTVQIAEAMAKIPERQKIQDKPPVDEVNRFRWDNDRHHQQRRCKRSKLRIAPDKIAVVAFAYFLANRADIIAEEAQKHVAPRPFRFPMIAVLVDR